MATIEQQELARVVPEYFLRYAVDVIQERAIPRLEDGLKPIQRRILYGMYQTHNVYSKPTMKCAKSVGYILASLSPHGDSSAYEAMVQLAQPFSMRYPLVYGHGNFGTQSGKPAAAYRYTEAKLSPVGELLLEDIEKETLDTQDNYDNTIQEPVALGGYFPNQLVNPCAGIAVGVATTLAPHYLKDVIRAAHLILDNMIAGKTTSIDDLIAIVKAPDFPTGGTIINASEMPGIYKTGKGRVVLQAKYEIKNNQIIFYELPYKINYDSLMTSLVQAAETIQDIKDIRDESSKSIRIIVELKKNAQPDYVIRQLFNLTELQSNFNCNFVAIDADGKPKERITLEDLFKAYLTRAAKTLCRALEFDKKKYEARIAIIDALLIAIRHVDTITHILRTSDTPVETLQQELAIDEAAANTICDTKFRTISKLSEQKLLAEKQELHDKVAGIDHIFSDQTVFLQTLQQKIDRIPELKWFANDTRKTDLADIDTNVDERDMVKDEQVVLMYTNHDIIKSIRVAEYQGTKHASKGVGMKLRDDEVILDMLTLSTRDTLFAFTNQGRCHSLPVYKIPITKRNQVGKYLSTLLNLDTGERVIHILAANDDLEGKCFLFTTRNGIVKRLNTNELAKRGTVTRCLILNDGDTLASVLLCKPKDHIVLISSGSKAVKFDIDDDRKPVTPQGRVSKGMKGMALKPGESIVASVVASDDKSFLTVARNGMVKRMQFDMLPLTNRGTAGVLLQSSKRPIELIVAMQADDSQELLIATQNGKVAKVPVQKFSVHNRKAGGTRGIKLDAGDTVVSADIADLEEEEYAVQQ